jgi:hypothetical protein
LYSSPSIIRMKSGRMRWAGHVARMGEKINACRILVGKLKGKRPLGRPRHRWMNNIVACWLGNVTNNSWMLGLTLRFIGPFTWPS